MPFDFSDRKTKTLLAIICVLIVAIIGSGIYYVSLLNTPSITIPNFIDQTKQDVLAWQEENHLLEEQISFEYSYDEEVEEDVVLAQSLSEGESLKKEDIFEITLSQGPDPEKEFEIPDFTDKSQEEIEQWFTDAKFSNVTFEYTRSDDIKEDLFVSMIPSASTLRRNSKVLVRVSLGNQEEDEKEVKEVIVPDFTTYSSATNIRAWGNTNRITIQISTKPSDTVSKGRVISQSVKAGTKVKSGTSISVVLSGGKAITVVSQVGQTKAQASSWAQANGLPTSFVEVYSTEPQGQILSQNPSSGSVDESTTITFQVSGGLVPIENYTGKTRDAFQAYINQLNTQKQSSAKIAIQVQEEESTSSAGAILRQVINGSNQSGTVNVNPGSQVTIVVAVGKKVSITSQSGTNESNFLSYLNANGMRAGQRSESYHESIVAGKVISNDTGTFASGTSIAYSVSLGAFQLDSSLYAPGASYNNLTATISRANGQGANWKVSSTNENSTQYDSGQIIACTISGKNVSCRVSNGKFVSVPNVIGTDYNSALTTLRNLGLTANASISQDYRNEPEGTVIAQSISAGSSVKQGSTILLTYSKGPKPVVMKKLPNINLGLWDGRTESEIRSALTTIFNNAGFYHLNFVVQDTSAGDNQNGIQSISPTPNGAEVDVETVITIVINVGQTQ